MKGIFTPCKEGCSTAPADLFWQASSYVLSPPQSFGGAAVPGAETVDCISGGGHVLPEVEHGLDDVAIKRDGACKV